MHSVTFILQKVNNVKSLQYGLGSSCCGFALRVENAVLIETKGQAHNKTTFLSIYFSTIMEKPLVSLFIVLFLSIQLYAPFRYYTREFLSSRVHPNDSSDSLWNQVVKSANIQLDPLDHFDERFSYRMFSSVRVGERCKVEFAFANGTKVEPYQNIRILQPALVDLLAYCRRDAIEAITVHMIQEISRKAALSNQTKVPRLRRTITAQNRLNNSTRNLESTLLQIK
jgi:hypothetical protein